MDPSCQLSVVVPVYGCADAVEPLCERVLAAVEPLALSVELVLVEDCGPDDSWGRIQRVAAREPRVRGFRLSRNFGQHAAITAGLELARGDRIVVMDCDLQDLPEDIPRLLAEADSSGADVVLARRVTRHDASFRRAAARAYFRVLRGITGSSIDGEFGTFSLVTRQVRDGFLRFHDQDRHYLFILEWLGFERATIDVEHAPRHSGRSSYGLARLVEHALDGMFFQTTKLLRWIVYAGFGVSALGALAALFLVFQRVNSTVYPGWTSVVVLLLLIGGFIIASTGITGLYVGKVFEQVKGRPLFIVARSTDKRAVTPGPVETLTAEVSPDRPGTGAPQTVGSTRRDT